MTVSPIAVQRSYTQKKIKTGLLLAAGRGFRLDPLTLTKPKCLARVNGRSILERLVNSLKKYDFQRLVVVAGYKVDQIRQFLDQYADFLDIDYVFNPLYATTNNIYSLYLARALMNQPFVLFESDIVFDPHLLKELLYPDRIAIAGIESWMNGSVVVMNQENRADRFLSDIPKKYDRWIKKTVNIYSFSMQSWQKVRQELGREIRSGCLNAYYETVFKKLVAQDRISFQGVSFDNGRWYEIDTINDLAMAEELFSKDAIKPSARPVPAGRTSLFRKQQ